MNNQQTTTDNGIYYFLGNITSHILHALPLYKELGGTFVVLSRKAEAEVRAYGVPVLVLDNKPRSWKRFGHHYKLVYHYLDINRSLRATSEYLNKHARVVIFYELYDFDPSVRLTKPKTVFLTHGNMLKNYMESNDRLEVLKQYDYMAALGPYMKREFIEKNHIDPHRLVDIGIARTDAIITDRGRVVLSDNLLDELGLDPKKKIFSYMPTFWGPSSIYNIGKEIVRNFPENYTLLFRPHPQTPDKLLAEYLHIIDSKPNVIYAPEGKYQHLGIIELFAASSAIIGDVSSVMLEAILTEKPLIFAYDSGEHKQSREEYRAIREIVDYSQKIDGQNIDSLETILDASLNTGVDTATWHVVKDRNFFYSNGGCTTAIATFIQKLL